MERTSRAYPEREHWGVLYAQGAPITTDKVHFVGGEDLILPEDDLYKARWNSPNPMSEPS